MRRSLLIRRSMQGILPFCLLLAISIFGLRPASRGRCGRSAGREPGGAARPCGLNKLLRAADELEQAGYKEQAAKARQGADKERQALQQQLDALQAQVEQIRLAPWAHAARAYFHADCRAITDQASETRLRYVESAGRSGRDAQRRQSV